MRIRTSNPISLMTWIPIGNLFITKFLAPEFSKASAPKSAWLRTVGVNDGRNKESITLLFYLIFGRKAFNVKRLPVSLIYIKSVDPT